MILKLLALSLILSATTFANSRGWPVKSELPEFLSVVADVPPIWGSADVVQSRCTFRVTLSNKRDTVLQLLNLNLVESRFMLIKADGTEVEWHIPKNMEGPGTNPGLTLGANSQIGFEIQMDRPPVPDNGLDGTIVFDAKVRFVAGDVITAADGKRGVLDGFTYTVVRRIPVAEILVK